jgi:SAM-dependent methyltransferase
MLAAGGPRGKAGARVRRISSPDGRRRSPPSGAVVTGDGFDRSDDWDARWSRVLRDRPDVLTSRPPNAHLVAEAARLPAGRALDAGCGHGCEALWLAARGWRVTAVDFSPVALASAARAAEATDPDVARRVDWVRADLATWAPEPDGYDLVVCLYVHSAGPMEEMVRRLAAGVAPGGRVLLVGHRPVDPATGEETAAAGQRQVSVAAAATLDPARWSVTVAEERPRAVAATGVDAVVCARRRLEPHTPPASSHTAFPGGIVAPSGGCGATLDRDERRAGIRSKAMAPSVGPWGTLPCVATVDWGDGDYGRAAAQLAPVADVVAEEVASAPGVALVDIGCGTGNLALAAALRGARAIGVDPSSALLEKARARAEEAGVVLDLRVGAAEALPVEDRAVDAAASVFGVIFAPEPEPAVAEMIRVVREAGVVAVTTWVEDGAIHRVAGLLAELLPQRPVPAPPWDDPSWVAGLLSSGGGREITVERRSITFRAPSPEAWFGEDEDHHPAWRAARRRARPQDWARIRRRSVAILREANEDPAAFAATSEYLLARCVR